MPISVSAKNAAVYFCWIFRMQQMMCSTLESFCLRCRGNSLKTSGAASVANVHQP